MLDVLLAEDLSEKIAAFEIEAKADTRTDVSSANLDSVTCWSDLWSDLKKTERRLTDTRTVNGSGRAVSDPDPGPGPGPGPDPGPDPATGTLQPEFQAYIAVLHTIRQAFCPQGPLAELERQGKGFDSELIELGFDRIARARRCISTDVEGAWELLDEAREKLGLQPLRPGSGVSPRPSGAPYSRTW